MTKEAPSLHRPLLLALALGLLLAAAAPTAVADDNRREPAPATCVTASTDPPGATVDAQCVIDTLLDILNDIPPS